MVEAYFCRSVDELTALILIDADKSTAARDNQVIIAVIVDVSPGTCAVAIQPVDAHLRSDLLEAECRGICRVDFAVLYLKPHAGRDRRRRTLQLPDRGPEEELVHRVHPPLHGFIEVAARVLELPHPVVRSPHLAQTRHALL